MKSAIGQILPAVPFGNINSRAHHNVPKGKSLWHMKFNIVIVANMLTLPYLCDVIITDSASG